MNSTPMNLAAVDVDTVWDDAEPLLAEALEHSDDTVEELYAKCKTGEADLLASDKCYVVVQQVEAPDNKFDVLIWAAASRGATDCVRSHLQSIEDAAFNAGARYVALKSASRGFSRLLPEGWSIKQYLFAKRLH